MALTFGATTSTRVNDGSAAGIDNLTALTLLCWVRITTLTSNRTFASKRTAGAGWFLGLSGTAGDVQFFADRATADTTYTTTDTPLATTGAWRFLAATLDQAAGAGALMGIYGGSLTTPATARALSATDGSGAFSADAAAALIWGNNSAFTVAIQGDVAQVALFGAVLSLADIQSWQLRPRVTVGGVVAKAFHRLGNEGAGSQQDYSGNGNTGTVTGATQAAGGPPLDEGELMLQLPCGGIYVPNYALSA